VATAVSDRRSLRARRMLVPYWLLLPGIAFLLLFYLLPTIQMFFTSLQTGSLESGYQLTWHWQTYADVITKYGTQLTRSIGYGLLVTVVCLLISYPVAYFIAVYGGKWKNALLFMIILPFFVSFIIRTLSWKFILADNGILLGPLKDLGIIPDNVRILATPVAVISGLIYNFLPFMILPLYASLEKLDTRMLEAAGDLYSNRITTFRKVTLPLSLPGVFAGSLLTFIPVVGDFINASLLGSSSTTMIGNVIQRRMLISNDYPEGAALSFLLMAGILVGVAVYARVLGTEELTG
jgi:spermidine/putrescine transport system permease protein